MAVLEVVICDVKDLGRDRSCSVLGLRPLRRAACLNEKTHGLFK